LTLCARSRTLCYKLFSYTELNCSVNCFSCMYCFIGTTRTTVGICDAVEWMPSRAIVYDFSYLVRLPIRSLQIQTYNRKAGHSTGMIWQGVDNFFPSLVRHRSQDISVGITTRLRAGRQWSWSSIPDRSKRFIFYITSKPALGVHQAFYTVDTGGSFPGGKTTAAWSWPLISI
jgi:hypothetical protein